MKRTALLLVALPGPASAHAAFGDLGPFYQGLLHPLADPAQGLLSASAAVALAGQPLASVRPGYATLAGAGLATLILGTQLALPAPDLRTIALTALLVALASLLPVRPGPRVVIAIALFRGVFVALPLGSGDDTRAILLGLIGGSAGIALATLFLWGAADWANRRIFRLASAVAAAWIAAISLMAAVLPA